MRGDEGPRPGVWRDFTRSSSGAPVIWGASQSSRREEVPASNHIPRGKVVEVEAWRGYYYAGTPSDGRTDEARKKAFQRGREKLQAEGIIGLDLVWMVADARPKKA
jgi:hypothetical protein